MKTTRYPQLLFVCFACVTALLVYSPGLTGGFALDDYTNIVQNAAVHVTDLSWSELSKAAFSFQAGPSMRPVSMLTFALNSYFFGADAEPFKAVNLAIHLLNGLLVFLLLLQLLQVYRRELAPSTPENHIEWLALLAGALWLLHPLNLMPVLYVVQRETALSSLFVLIGVDIYIWARARHLAGRSGIWLIWTVVPLSTLIAVLCKESGALLPVYTLVIEFFIFRFRRPSGGVDRSVALFYTLILALPGSAGLVWTLLAHGGGYLNYANRDYTLAERLMSEARVVWLYIRWTLLPDLGSLGLYHDDIAISRGLLHPITTLSSIAGLIALAVACILLRVHRPLVALGIAWFLGGQLMESTVFPLELAYEHRCYLPDMGLILAITSVVYPLGAHGRFKLPRYGLIASMLCACACLTWLRAGDWSDNLTFSASEAHHHPESPYATYMLGQTYANLALFEDASQYSNAVTSLEAASAVPKSGIIPDVSLLLVRGQLRGLTDPDVLQRIAMKLHTRRINASDIQGLSALVDCVDRRNCNAPPAGMLAIFDQALSNPEIDKLTGARANVLVIYGNYLSSQKNPDLPRARALMAQAAALVPTEPQYLANLVTMDINMRDPERAVQDLEALRKLNYLGHLDTEIADFETQIARLRSESHR
ncbi:MAG TPA: hypothetical protein VGT99_10425 [Gammaproteobacteria bacterium]|nr:hypothetical protein [Gammaproteobacteria bacterium]